MGTENTRTLLDRLTRVSEPTLNRLRESAGGASSAGGRMAVKFSVGDRVIDLATGQRGTVLRIEHARAPLQSLYSITLADGRVVFRDENELAVDQAVAPAPESTR